MAAQYREITPAQLLIALSRFSNTEEFAEVDAEHVVERHVLRVRGEHEQTTLVMG